MTYIDIDLICDRFFARDIKKLTNVDYNKLFYYSCILKKVEICKQLLQTKREKLKPLSVQKAYTCNLNLPIMYLLLEYKMIDISNFLYKIQKKNA
jgi:hypothetical protein